MQRRKFVIGLGALAAGGAAAAGTGAFTSVTANRDIEVDVADDASAFLRLEATDSDNADEFVEESGDMIEINITETTEDGRDDTLGEGLNPDAVTVIDDLFVVGNQGTQDVEVEIQGSFEPIDVFVSENTSDDQEEDDYSDDILDDSEQVDVGEEITLGLELDSDGYDDDDILDTDFTLEASVME